MFIDTHCHIQFQAYKDDREAVIHRCREKGMMLNIVGTQTDTSTLAVELAEQYDFMYASIGTHPIHLHPTHVDEEETHFMSREEGFDEAHYEKLAQSKKVIGVGECGLDLFHLPKDKPMEEVLAKQKEVFLAHVNFAHKHDLPLVIHCREAHDQMIEVLKGFVSSAVVNHPGPSALADEGPSFARRGQSEDEQKLSPPLEGGAPSPQAGGVVLRGTVHCYTSNWTHAEQYLNMGLHLGFTGVITFPPKKTDPKRQLDLLEVVEKIPLDRMVVETDAPYLAPQAYRGQRAEPWMVEEVVKKIAEVKGLRTADVEKQVEKNSKQLFQIT